MIVVYTSMLIVVFAWLWMRNKKAGSAFTSVLYSAAMGFDLMGILIVLTR